MQYYVVGGAIRDMLLGFKPKDIDFVVVGASKKEMDNLYSKPVGHHFPVYIGKVPKFQHLGNVEIAMARTELKIPNMKGHKSFICEFGKHITLEEDLKRRDFTINAMAYDTFNNVIIDIFNGQNDLDNEIIKHVNEKTFIDDPLRVLRMARLAAKLNFNVHPKTFELSKKVNINFLSIERVWIETKKALESSNPEKYFSILLKTGHLKQFLPELVSLVDVPHAYHIEDPFEHTMMSIQKGTEFELPSEAIYAILLHDIGKSITPINILPHHYEHDKNSAILTKIISDRLNVPNKYKNLAIFFAKNHMKMHKIKEMNYKTLTKFSVEIIKSGFEAAMLIKMSLADVLGRKKNNSDILSYERLLDAIDIISKIDAKDIVAKGVIGAKVGELLHQKRVDALKKSKI